MLGIFLGYVLGKPLGILRRSLVGSRAAAQAAPPISWPVLGIGGAVAGIGFTVSLLVSSLAFEGAAARRGEGRRARGGDRRADRRWA